MKTFNGKTIGAVHQLESFGLVDGPGVRFVIFLQGCRMRCRYCHNPETWQIPDWSKLQRGDGSASTAFSDPLRGQDPVPVQVPVPVPVQDLGSVQYPVSVQDPGLYGSSHSPCSYTLWTSDALFERVYRFRHYWKNNGGITVSGGEPLLQLDFVTELFTLAHEKGIHTALDTAGEPFDLSLGAGSLWQGNEDRRKAFENLMAVTDLVILDLKIMDSDRHAALTGHSNEPMLNFARFAADHGVSLWLRRVLVPGLTDDPEDLAAMRRFADGLFKPSTDPWHGAPAVERIEVLPYHTLGIAKWQAMGLPYPLDGVQPPTEEAVRKAEEILTGD